MWCFACRQLQERLEQPSDAVPHAGRQGKYSKCETHQKLKAWNFSSPFRQTTAYFCRLIPSSFQCSQLAAKLQICNTTLCFVWVLEVKEDYHETRLQAEAMNSLESRQHFETLCGCLMIFVGFVCFCKCTAWNTPSSSFARSVTSLAFVRALPGNQTSWACPNTFGAQPESSGDIQWVRGGSMTCTWVLHGFCWKSYCSIHPKCNRSVQESFSVNGWNCTKTALFTVGTEKCFNASGLRPSSLQDASTKRKPNHKETRAQPALIELFCIVYELTHIYIYMHMLVFRPSKDVTSIQSALLVLKKKLNRPTTGQSASKVRNLTKQRVMQPIILCLMGCVCGIHFSTGAEPMDHLRVHGCENLGEGVVVVQSAKLKEREQHRTTIERLEHRPLICRNRCTFMCCYIDFHWRLRLQEQSVCRNGLSHPQPIWSEMQGSSAVPGRPGRKQMAFVHLFQGETPKPSEGAEGFLARRQAELLKLSSSRKLSCINCSNMQRFCRLVAAWLPLCSKGTYLLGKFQVVADYDAGLKSLQARSDQWLMGIEINRGLFT